MYYLIAHRLRTPASQIPQLLFLSHFSSNFHDDEKRQVKCKLFQVNHKED